MINATVSTIDLAQNGGLKTKHTMALLKKLLNAQE